ncbi:helix-turn-helix domain-containing protein, partial [Allomesorhizobium alhagi]
MGRPTLYSEALAAAIRAYVEQGFSLSDIAEEIGVARMTIYRWGRNVTTLRRPLKHTRAPARECDQPPPPPEDRQVITLHEAISQARAVRRKRETRERVEELRALLAPEAAAPRQEASEPPPVSEHPDDAPAPLHGAHSAARRRLLRGAKLAIDPPTPDTIEAIDTLYPTRAGIEELEREHLRKQTMRGSSVAHTGSPRANREPASWRGS